jgi:hypothetical protein
MSERTRRNVLCSIAGAAALAGCSESTPTGTDPFETVAVEDSHLVVEVADTAEGDIAVIDPTGESFAEADRTPGETRLTFELGVAYTPGEYEVSLYEGDQRHATTSIDIRPELEILEAGIGANHPERMPDSLGNLADVECFIEVHNIGSGPTAIEKLEFAGDVPNPTDLQASESGIFDEKSGLGAEEVPLNPDSVETIFSNTLPFFFEGYGVDCQEERYEGDCHITVSASNHPDITQQFKVEYPAADEYDGCTPKIRGGEGNA